MKWKKLVSLLIVSVFIVSALAAVNGPAKAQEGQYVDSITIEVRTNQQTALGEVATRDLDVFLQAVSGSLYDSISDSWKQQMNTWTSVGGYNSQYYNPAHTESPYECEVEGQLQFNPFAIKKIRQAQYWLINREQIVNELYNGYAEPRYCWCGVTDPGYEQYFSQIVEKWGITATGDKQKGLQMVQEAMETARDDSALKGELRKDGGFWEYKPPGGSWSDIEITGITRIEDTREQIGEYQSDLLNDCGFKVNNRKMDRNSYGDIVWSDDPADLTWQFYTGGWLASAAQYYQEVVPAQMGSGWYGYMPGGFVPSADYRYGYWSQGNAWDNPPENKSEYEFYGNITLAQMTTKLYNGWVNDIDQYWNWMQQATDMMLDQAVRNFIVSTYDFYAYDKDTIVTAATDVVTGWSDVFTPRTMRTQDGTLTAAQYSSQGALYMDNWNELGGSSDVYGLQQKRMVFDGAYNLDPSTGIPRPMRMDWTGGVEQDFYWAPNETGVQTLYKNISVPEDAVIYDHANHEWTEVGTGVKSAVKVTYDITTGAWQFGEDLTTADVMGFHAWSWDMSYDDGAGDNFYHDGYGGQMRPYYSMIQGEKWDEQNDTYTVWADYSLPVEDKIGAYLSTFPQLHYTQYMATQFLINENGEYTPSGAPSYSWDEGQQNWVHWLSSAQGEDITDTLQNMIDKNYMPWFMTEDANAPITVTQSELNAKRQGIIDFYNDHDHVYASQGPFMMDTVNAANMYVDMVRFGQDQGYPYPEDYWQDKFEIAKMIVTGSDIPNIVTAPDSINVQFDVQVDEDYPRDITRDVVQGDDPTAEIQLIDELDNVVANTTGTLIASTYTASFNTSDLSSGQYTVRFMGSIPAQVGEVTATGQVVVERVTNVEITNFNVNPTTVTPNENFDITATAENTGSDQATVNVMAGGETIDSYLVDPGATVDISTQHSFENPGTYQIEIGDQTAQVEVISPNLEVTNFQVPSTGVVDTQITMSVSVENTGTAELTDDIFIDGESVESFTLAAGASRDLTIDHTFTTPGDHTVSVGTEQRTITITSPVNVESADVSPTTVQVGGTAEITATITNNDDVSHDVSVTVGGTEVTTWTVEAGASSQEYTYTHTFNTVGDHEVKVAGTTAGTVTVEGAIVIDDASVSPTTVDKGEDVTITATISNNDATSHDVVVTANDNEIHTWTVDANTDEEEFTYTHSFDTADDYTIKVEDETAGTVTVQGGIVIDSTDVSPKTLKKGEKITITATITNHEDTEQTISVKVAGSEVTTWTVDAHADGVDKEYTYKMEEKGDHEVTVGETSVGTVTVEKKDDDGTPGFTMVLLGISAIAAVALYYRRRR